MSAISTPRAAAENPKNHPRLGLPGYSAIRVLQGGMSIVYLCERNDDREPVAVKRLKPKFVAKMGTGFLRECYLWLLLGSHPNIVRALEAHGYPPNQPTLMLEYVEQSLREMMAASGQLALDEVLRIGIGIADGLEYAVQKMPGFVHGDMKPENVLVGNGCVAKVTDLGLAHAAVDVLGLSTPVGGTPMYMAPEQVRGSPAGPASDIYAIGCIIHEAVTGSPVFGYPISVENYMSQHLNAEPIPLNRLRHRVPPALSTLVSRCLAKDPGKRPSVAELNISLRAVAGSR